MLPKRRGSSSAAAPKKRPKVASRGTASQRIVLDTQPVLEVVQSMTRLARTDLRDQMYLPTNGRSDRAKSATAFFATETSHGFGVTAYQLMRRISVTDVGEFSAISTSIKPYTDRELISDMVNEYVG
jgi:hypothetical protein